MAADIDDRNTEALSTTPKDDRSQKFTVGEIAGRIFGTHKSVPSVSRQDIIHWLVGQAVCNELPVSFLHSAIPEDETIFLTRTGAPYRSEKSAVRAAGARADLQQIDWQIVGVDGGWGIKHIWGYDDWWEYWAKKDDMTVDERGDAMLVSSDDMTRFCSSRVYQVWSIARGLSVPAAFDGKVAPMQADPPAQPHSPQPDQIPKNAGVPLGRPLGSGSFEMKDAPLVKKMEKLVKGGSTISAAARKFADKAAGNSTFESKTKRLMGRYSKNVRKNGD